MKIKKLAFCAVTVCMLTFTAVAQDDWDGGWDDSGTESSDDDFGSFDDSGSDSLIGFGSSASGSAITFSGRLTFDGRYYFAKDDSEYFRTSYMSFDSENLRFLQERRLTTMIRWNDTYPDVYNLTDQKKRYFDDLGYREVDYDDNEIATIPAARLGVAYSGNKADASLSLNLTKQTLRKYQEDIIDEMILRGYFFDNRFTVEAGKMKVVWGKGDKLHVLDNFNADDYTDFIIPDYIDRRISTPMLRLAYSFPTKAPLSVEALWTPFLPTDRFATEGVWTPAAYAKLSYLTQSIIAWDYTRGTMLASDVSSFETDDLFPNTHNIRYSQGGFKVGGTVAALDWGVSYYIGRYKQPSVNLDKTVTPIQTCLLYKAAAKQYLELAEKAANAGDAAAAANYATLATNSATAATNALNYIGLPSLDYDRKQTVGLEFAAVLGRFNLRGEAGYNLTNDMAGDDPWVHNNSIQWLFGFDFDLPISNLNVNIQETGTYILGSNNIKDWDFAEYDVDYDPESRYTNDKLVVNISDSWLNDRLKPELTFLWGLERGDFVFQPKLTYAPNPYVSFSLSGVMIHAKDEYSEFYAWKNNNFVNFGVKLEF